MRMLVPCCVIATTLLIAASANGEGFDFDETFRYWGDADHMGTGAVLGASAVRVNEGVDRTAFGGFASFWGQGVAYRYAPSSPRSFRFAGFGTIGALSSGDETSFDGAIGGEAMYGYRISVPELEGDKRWPRSELVARAGFGFHVLGNHLLYSSALEVPRLEVGFRHDGWYGGRMDGDWYRRDSYSLELRAVATLLATGSYQLSIASRDLDVAPAWGGQLDLIGVRPEINVSYLRVLSELDLPVDRFDVRGCVKLGPKEWSRHPYLICAQWRLQYAIERDAELDAPSLRATLSFGASD